MKLIEVLLLCLLISIVMPQISEALVLIQKIKLTSENIQINITEELYGK